MAGHPAAMRGQATFEEFFRAILAEFATIPRRGLIEVGLLYAVFAGYRLLDWQQHSPLIGAAYATLAVAILASVLTTYSITMTLVGAHRSLQGFLKFLLTLLAMLLPLVVTIVVLLIWAKFYKHAVALIPILFLMLGSVGVLTLLPAWPVAQALAGRAVSPVRMLRATEGHRWALISVSFITGGLNRLVPDIDKARNLGEASLVVLAGAAIGCATMILGASIAVAAWKLAAQRDSGLGGAVDI